MKEQLSATQVFESAQQNFGIVPPLIKEIAAGSVAVAQLYMQGVVTMETSSLSELEINAIELKISRMNNCESCMKGHSYLVKKAGLGDDDIQAILAYKPVSDARLNKLLDATEFIYQSGKDRFSDAVLNFFQAKGITDTEVFEIIGLISLKTISNYINNYMVSVKKKQAVAA